MRDFFASTQLGSASARAGFGVVAIIGLACLSLHCTTPSEEATPPNDVDAVAETGSSPDTNDGAATRDTTGPDDGGRTDLVVPVDTGDTGRGDAPVAEVVGDVAPDDGASDGGAAQPGLYRPDDGPGHEDGTIVDVCNEGDILSAISNADPGDVITVCPGTFAFNQKINVNRDGQASARIFLRAEAPGTVTLNLSHIENFNISAKFWVFENITFFGDCSDSSGCEHAFHIVGDADDLIFRTNEVVNFASHVKLNAEVVGSGPAKSFPDRTMFIRNTWRNTKYIPNNAPHNILNIDGGVDHVVRGNVFADYNTPASLPKSASAVYPKASTLRMLVEQNLIICEKVRTEGETTRGIQLGDNAPASICDGDTDQDGLGDCEDNGQSQEITVRNNIIMNCNNGGSAAGIMVSSDRDSKILHNTVINTDPRKGAFYVGHPNHETFWRSNIIENGFDTNYAVQSLTESDNVTPSPQEVSALFTGPAQGDLSLAAGATLAQVPSEPDVTHDFCGYPRGDTADLGAIEYSTTFDGLSCAEKVKQMFDKLP